MIKKTVICDRCGAVCIDGEYQTLEFEIHNVDPHVGYLNERNPQERHYCEKCTDEIREFAFNKEVKSKPRTKIEDQCENCRWIISCINGEIEKCLMKE